MQKILTRSQSETTHLRPSHGPKLQVLFDSGFCVSLHCLFGSKLPSSPDFSDRHITDRNWNALPHSLLHWKKSINIKIYAWQSIFIGKFTDDQGPDCQSGQINLLHVCLTGGRSVGHLSSPIAFWVPSAASWWQYTLKNTEIGIKYQELHLIKNF